MDSKGMKALPENARSVAGKPLPPLPKNPTPDKNGNLPVSIVLFYQYIEPSWTEPEHRAALKFVLELAKKNKVNGRGRCAPEGLNCTLSGPPQGVRDFCMGLRAWNPTFNDTDFKITDDVYFGKRFKALTIRKTNELVAYGLSGEMAPSLKHSTAVTLEADKYHQMMADENTVIIDVRNKYESDIGHFQPPEGGAELLKPKMRNSYEFPKWLNAPETKEKLQGKKVMMYCTGGIRCERASALLDQMEKATEELSTEGVYHCRGGIERYLKTYPEGGYWKGKNYLFDRRFEQKAELKDDVELEQEVNSFCAVCAKPWTLYRGQHRCPEPLCKVPVLVCFECINAKAYLKKPPYCPLCVEGYELRKLEMPDIVDHKRKLYGGDVCAPQPTADEDKPAMEQRSKRHKPDKEPSRRLFVGNIPLVVTASSLKETLGMSPECVQWIVDRTTGAFYGSAFVWMKSVGHAKGVMGRARSAKGLYLGGGGARLRRLRVNFAPVEEGQESPTGAEKELPPISA